MSDEAYSSQGYRPPELTDPYYYEKNVVLLMDQRSQSSCETMIMCLRTGRNVTVLGSNSIGANGNIANLLLPCGSTVTFSSFGAFLPDNEQTQRVGLAPDVYFEQTIEGVRDGRDELMEAAIIHLSS